MPRKCCQHGCAIRLMDDRRTRRLPFLATLALTVFLAGPGRASDRIAANEEDPALTQCEWYPLAVGTQWIYSSGPLVLREKVVRHEALQGESCARIETYAEDRVVHIEHVAVREDGLYRVAIAGKPVEPPLRFLALPPEPGQKWTVDSKIGGQSLQGEFVTSEGAFTVRSPRGDRDNTFKTHRVAGEKFLTEGAEISLSCDFVARVGKVRHSARFAGQELTLELRDLLTPGQTPTRTVEGGSRLLLLR